MELEGCLVRGDRQDILFIEKCLAKKSQVGVTKFSAILNTPNQEACFNLDSAQC